MNDCIYNHPELCCRMCDNKIRCMHNAVCDRDGMDLNWDSFKTRQQMYGYDNPMSSLKLVREDNSKRKVQK